jgi:hypothetical protein
MIQSQNMRDLWRGTFRAAMWWLDGFTVEDVTIDGEPGWRVSGWYLNNYLRYEHRSCVALVRDLRAMRARIDAADREAWSA